jgi:hypothetical protein
MDDGLRINIFDLLFFTTFFLFSTYPSFAPLGQMRFLRIHLLPTFGPSEAL